MTLQVKQLQCLTTAGNTGVGSCYLDIATIVGAILAPKGYQIGTATLQANLIAGTHAASKANRLFPIYDFKNITDSSEKPVIQSFPNGSKAFVRDGFNDWAFQFISGGASLLQQLRKFSKKAYDFYFIDSDGKLLGIPGSDSSHLRAFPSDGGFFMAMPWKPNDGSKVTEYVCNFIFNSKYSADLIDFVLDTSFDIQSTVFGLQDVNLSGVADATSGSYDITPSTDATGTSLYDLFSVSLAATGMWVATNNETGLTVPILTSVAGTTVNKNFIIGLDKTSGNYPGAGQHVNINLAAPAVLQAAGIDGYESTGGVVIAKN